MMKLGAAELFSEKHKLLIRIDWSVNMSIITTEPNHILDLPIGTQIRNVIGSSRDSIIIRTQPNTYLNHNHYEHSVGIQDNTISSWIDVCRYFAGDNGNCCICGDNAMYGGHIILGDHNGGGFENQRTQEGSNRVFIVPLCGRCNQLPRIVMQISRLTHALHIFDYKRVYQTGNRIIVMPNQVYIPRQAQNRIERQIRTGIDNSDINYVRLIIAPPVNQNIQGRQ